MVKIKVKGHELDVTPVKDSSSRRALSYKNKIIQSLKKLGVREEQIEIPIGGIAHKKVPAFAEWYMQGHYLYYDHKLFGSFAENLFIVSKVIELEVASVLNEEKNIQEFVDIFMEDDDLHERRKAARETLGLDHDTNDVEAINKQYKELAKEHHPDREGGSVDKFKEINNAHKILKRELE
ncbi:MAG: DnaJ domain-containing protein [archaeon]